MAEIPDLDATAFAVWLKEAFQQSRFKSITELAAAVGSNKATISRLMSGAPQTLTGKPSKPRPALVLALAEALGADESKGMELSGHIYNGSKKPRNFPELVKALGDLGIEIDFASLDQDFSSWTPDDFEELKDQIAADVGVKIRRITSR
jgi:hypothetical protein